LKYKFISLNPQNCGIPRGPLQHPAKKLGYCETFNFQLLTECPHWTRELVPGLVDLVPYFFVVPSISALNSSAAKLEQARMQTIITIIAMDIQSSLFYTIYTGVMEDLIDVGLPYLEPRAYCPSCYGCRKPSELAPLPLAVGDHGCLGGPRRQPTQEPVHGSATGCKLASKLLNQLY
jgi:hypothetical protein